MSQVTDKPRSDNWVSRIRSYSEHIPNTPLHVVQGKLTRMVGMTLEAVGIHAPVGARCLVTGADNEDIEFGVLPAELYGTVSFIRVFKHESIHAWEKTCYSFVEVVAEWIKESCLTLNS